MLMLVVTIIIAAVVSAFAGGLSSDQSKAPQATLGVTPVVQGINNTAGFTANNGLLFEHKGGDPFALGDIKIQLQSQDAKTTIGLDDTLAISHVTSDAVTAYLMKVGDSDTFINPGDKFMLYADNCRIDSMGSQISWKPEGAVAGFGAYLNTKCEYKVIDKNSGKAIQSGEFVLH
jgi:FlaG/FlaF family flagellin (archaellin)